MGDNWLKELAVGVRVVTFSPPSEISGGRCGWWVMGEEGGGGTRRAEEDDKVGVEKTRKNIVARSSKAQSIAHQCVPA